MLAARGPGLLTCWLALGIALSAAPRSARAGDRTIVVLEVEGEDTPRLRQALERILKTQHDILPASAYRDAARRLRAKKLTPNNVMKVCAYLKVDAVIDATVEQDEEGYRFIIRLRSAANGIIEKKFPLRLSEPRLREVMADKLAARLMPAIEDLPEIEKDGQEATRVAAARRRSRVTRDSEREEAAGAKQPELSEVDGKRGRRTGRGDGEVLAGRDREDGRGEGRRRRTAGAGGDDGGELGDGFGEDGGKGERTGQRDGEDGDGGEGDGDGGEGDGGDDGTDGSIGGDDADGSDADGSIDGEAESLTASASTPRTTPLLINAGLSFMGRKLSFSYSGAEGSAPAGFSGTPVPGAYVAGELYPGGFGTRKRGGLADLGIGFVFDRVIKLNATVGEEMEQVSLSTRMWRYGVNLRYRHNFDAAPNGYSVHGSLGFNTAGFVISKSDAPDTTVDVPNVSYKYIDAGVGGRVPIGRKLSLLAQADFLAPFNTGEIQTNEQYGPATVMGFDGEAVFEYQFTRNVMARAGARFMLVKFSFDGDGALDDHDENGENDVSGASDRYLGGFVTAGYWF